MNPFQIVGDWLSGGIVWMLDLVQAIGPGWGALIAFAGVFLETTILLGIVVPGDTLVVAVATAVREPWQYVLLLVAVVVGTLAGQSVGFLLGRWIGPAIRASRLGRWIGEANWDRAAAFVDRRGPIAVFVSRFLPVLHALMPLTVGMSSMRYRRFILSALPAAIIWGFVYVSLGTFAASWFRANVDSLEWAGYAFAGIVVVFALVAWLVKRRLDRGAAHDTTAETPVPAAESGGGGKIDPDGGVDGPVHGGR